MKIIPVSWIRFCPLTWSPLEATELRRLVWVASLAREKTILNAISGFTNPKPRCLSSVLPRRNVYDHPRLLYYNVCSWDLLEIVAVHKELLTLWMLSSTPIGTPIAALL